MNSTDKLTAGLRQMTNSELRATGLALADAIHDHDRLAVRAVTHAAMRRTRPLPAGARWGTPPSLDAIRAARA